MKNASKISKRPGDVFRKDSVVFPLVLQSIMNERKEWKLSKLILKGPSDKAFVAEGMREKSSCSNVSICLVSDASSTHLRPLKLLASSPQKQLMELKTLKPTQKLG